MDQSTKQLKDTLNRIRKVINKGALDSNIKDSILVPIPIIEDKIDTQKIHVGLIGESTRDKLMVLNSMLNTDFFILSGDDNQERLVRTLIEFSPEQTLSVAMFNGKVYDTKNNMLRLTKKFLPERYRSFSFIDKIKYFFGAHKDVQTNSQIVHELYHNMVVSPDVHENVSSLRLGLPLESIPDYLVIVDTPSLNAKSIMSQRIIKETVKILCDEIIVITPHDNLYSDKVRSFIKGTMIGSQDLCRIFITGTEGIKDEFEREDFVAAAANRAQNELNVSSRKVMGAPVALELALRGIPTHLSQQEINAMDKEDRDELLKQYKNDLQKCYDAYNIRKETAVVEKKFAVVEDYIRFIRYLLENTTRKNNEEAEELRKQMVPPLNDFLRKFFTTVDVREKTKDVCTGLLSECKGFMNDFVDSTFTQIDQAAMNKNPKDAVQGVMKERPVIEEGNKTCAKCHQAYIYKFDYIKGVYRDVFVRLESDLRKTYGITDSSLKIGEKMRPIPPIPYNMSLVKTGVTTFKLKRIFTSVSTIQAQMKQAIKDTCSKFFGQLAGTYCTSLTTTMKTLDMEANQLRDDVIKRYKGMIDSRMAELYKRDRFLKDNNSSLASLKDIVSTSIGYDVK